MTCLPRKTGLKVLIGRSSQCDFTIENPESHGTVSGKHATIYQTQSETEFLLEDHSTNGTYVNGELVHNSERYITIDDVITLGRSYNLNFRDIAARYLSSSKTTDRKRNQQIADSAETFRKQSPVLPPEPEVETSPNSMFASGGSVIPGQAQVYVPEEPVETPKRDEPEIIVTNKIPVWCWVLMGALFILGYLLGTM